MPVAHNVEKTYTQYLMKASVKEQNKAQPIQRACVH